MPDQLILLLDRTAYIFQLNRCSAQRIEIFPINTGCDITLISLQLTEVSLRTAMSSQLTLALAKTAIPFQLTLALAMSPKEAQLMLASANSLTDSQLTPALTGWRYRSS